MKVKNFIREHNWVKECTALTSEGKFTFATGLHAVQWDLGGLIIKCYGVNSGEIPLSEPLIKAIHYVRKKHPNMYLSTYNDLPSTSFEDIKRLVTDLDI